MKEGPGVSTDELEVGTIVAAVKAKIDSNPALRAHPAIKNILVQVQIYNKENRRCGSFCP